MKFKINDNKTKLILTDSTTEEYNQLKTALKPFVENHRFQPRVKLGVWDGRIDFFNNGFIDLGLWHFIKKLCDEYKYPFIIENKEEFPKESIKKQDVIDFCDEFYKGYRLPDKKTKPGGEFKPYDHQIEAIYKILKFRYGLVEVATAGGKSLILSTIMFYILRNINPDAKFLIIVPNISLVVQIADDILDYNEGYNKENKDPFDINIMEIMSDKPRKVRDGKTPNVFIGTYQSLEKLPIKFFQNFDFVATDEAHRAKSVSIKKILTRTLGIAKWRFGVSGTFPSPETANGLTIQSTMGPNLFEIKAKKLQEKGLISELKIKSLILNHDNYDFAQNIYALKRRGGGKRGLELEKEYIHNSEKRKYFILKLIKKLKSNSLILFHSISYGTELYDFLRDNTENIDFYYVDGSTKSEKREYIKKKLEETSDNIKIGVCSFGTFSTGINVKAISNIIFVDSFKSDQIIRQSIGRGLRLHDEKVFLTVYDISDKFHSKFKNTLYLHYIHRRDKIYKPQEFEYEEINIKL